MRRHVVDDHKEELKSIVAASISLRDRWMVLLRSALGGDARVNFAPGWLFLTNWVMDSRVLAGALGLAMNSERVQPDFSL